MNDLFISEENNSLVLKIEPDKIITLEELTLQKGQPGKSVVLNQGTLEIKNVRVEK